MRFLSSHISISLLPKWEICPLLTSIFLQSFFKFSCKYLSSRWASLLELYGHTSLQVAFLALMPLNMLNLLNAPQPSDATSQNSHTDRVLASTCPGEWCVHSFLRPLCLISTKCHSVSKQKYIEAQFRIYLSFLFFFPQNIQVRKEKKTLNDKSGFKYVLQYLHSKRRRRKGKSVLFHADFLQILLKYRVWILHGQLDVYNREKDACLIFPLTFHLKTGWFCKITLLFLSSPNYSNFKIISLIPNIRLCLMHLEEGL